MLKYSIKKLAASTSRRRPGQVVLLPAITPSNGAELSYLKVLRQVLKGIFAAVKQDVLPVVERELAQQRRQDRLVQDVDSATFERIKHLGEQLGLIANNAMERILGLEAQRHTKQFMTTAKKTLGIDLSAVVTEEDLQEALTTMATRNAGLIRGLTEDVIRRVQTTVTTAVLNGETATELRKKLTEDFNFGDKRAKLIARDQIAKTTSDLNRLRHTQAGIAEYDFSTSDDERVRPKHKVMDGRVCRYDDATVYLSDGKWVSRAGIGGVMLHPGQDIQCRCVSRARIVF